MSRLTVGNRSTNKTEIQLIRGKKQYYFEYFTVKAVSVLKEKLFSQQHWYDNGNTATRWSQTVICLSMPGFSTRSIAQTQVLFSFCSANHLPSIILALPEIKPPFNHFEFIAVIQFAHVFKSNFALCHSQSMLYYLA